MKALVFAGQGDVHLERVDDPTPAPDEVVIEPDYVQICTTDVVNFERWPPDWRDDSDGSVERQRGGQWPAVMTEGMVPGHEGGGRIVAIGSAVTEFEIGQTIAVDSTYRCGSCPECREMRWRDCSVYAQRSNRPGVPGYLGINSTEPERWGRGLMAEYCAVPVSMSYACPESVEPLAKVSMEIGGPTLGSVRTSSLQIGDNVVQIGGELYGSLRMQLARLGGAGTIVYVESNPARLAWARRLQLADVIIDSNDVDPVEEIRGTFPRGVDLVFPSSTAADSWRIASRIVRQGGTIAPFDGDPRLGIDFLGGMNPATMTGDGVRWLGYWPPISSAEPMKGGKGRNDHQIFMDLMAQGRVDGTQPVTSITSMSAPQDQIDLAFTSSWRTEVRTVISVERG